MAKGPAGFALPGALRGRLRGPGVALAPPAAHGKRALLALRALTLLEAPSGVLILLAVAMPWFVAMYVRHGQPFTDRLIFHDMFKRAFTHVHDTNDGDDMSFRFYVWQLGYATFPWMRPACPRGSCGGCAGARTTTPRATPRSSW